MEKRIHIYRVLGVLMFALMLAAGFGFRGHTAFAQDEEVHLEKVHPLYWKAVLRKPLKKGKTVLAPAKTQVLVIKRGLYKGKSVIMLPNGQSVKVSNSVLSIKGDYPTIEQEGDYNTATKEAFINRTTNVRPKDKYLIWVSQDKMRINIFVPSENQWKLYKVYKCSTGKAKTPTKTGWKKVDFKNRVVKGLKYYTDVAGGGIHKWPGHLKKSIYGRHVASHGCIRTSEEDAREIYHMIPLKTRVLVY